MKSDIESALEILNPRINHELLNGIYEVMFNAEKTKFYAFTYLPIIKEVFSNISYLFSKWGHGAYADTEKKKKYISADTWQSKTTEECIHENIYTHYSFRFTGMFYEGDWFITKDLTYLGPEINEETARAILKFNGHEFDYWNAWPFTPGEPLVLKEQSFYRDIEKEEFENLPAIVADIKQGKKSAVNSAFRRYLNEEIFIPFSEKLKIKEPSNYNSYVHMYSEDFELLFPQHKKYAIMAAVPKDEIGQYRIEYFVYIKETPSLFRWTFPGQHLLKSCHTYFEDIITDLAKVSDWNDWKFINSSRTLDDESFWNNYVFKKEGANYLYLSEIIF